MQKFVFSKTIYAANMETAMEIMETIIDEACDGGDGVLGAFESRKIARKPPFEKPGSLYYTVRDGKKGRRLGAVMLLKRDCGDYGSWHRGVCIVGEGDTFNGREARRRTWDRAYAAALHAESSEPVKCISPLVHTTAVQAFGQAFCELPGNTGCSLGWKSEYCCRLTPYEKQLLSGKGDVSCGI